MKYKVTVSPDAAMNLPVFLQQKLARRAARKVMRMGSTSAIVIFSGPHNLRVVVNCKTATIVIYVSSENAHGSIFRLMRKAA